MPYTQITRAQLRIEILQAMRAGTFWADEEVNFAINEGLLLWGALSGYWRERGQFSTAPGTAYYDLSVQLPILRARTVTLGELTKTVQYHLIEPPSGVAGTNMSAQFSINEFTAALARKRNELVIDAKLPFTSALFPLISPPPAGRFLMPETVVGIGRMMWKDATTGIYSPMRREDAWSMDSRNPFWTLEPGTPYAYSTAETRPIEVQLYPAPLNSGSIEALYTASVDLVVSDTTALQLPDELTPAVTWGALYSLLATQNEGFDPLRSKYALERYKQIVSVAQNQWSVNRVQSNDVPLSLVTFEELDSFSPFWRNTLSRPGMAACIYDIIALGVVPSGVFGITCDVIRTAPLPQLDSDFIQMGREEIYYLIDYVRHILSFKLAGAEFAATMPLLDSFLSGAAQRNSLLKIQSKYYTSLFGQSALEQSYAPVA